MANLFADGSAAGFAQRAHGQAALTQAGRKQIDLCGFAAAFGALEGDEASCHGSARPYCTFVFGTGVTLAVALPAVGWTCAAAAAGAMPFTGFAFAVMESVRNFTSDSICSSVNGPPSVFANAGIIEPGRPERVHLRQCSSFVG